MTNPQGTEWETELVNRLQDAGLMAARLPEGGSKDLGDVWIGAPPDSTPPSMVVVAWKRLTGEGSRRTPDGERDVVILSTDDFIRLLKAYMSQIVPIHPEDPLSLHRFDDLSVIVECRWREKLNVTRTLAKAREKAAG